MNTNLGYGEPLNSLKIRAMKVVLTLQKGTFHNDTNIKTMYGCSLAGYLHMDASIQRMSSFTGCNAVIDIFGMLLADCESATKFNPNAVDIKFYDQVQIYAGYIDSKYGDTTLYNISDVEKAIDQLPIVFSGLVITAYTDFNNPTRPFKIQANLYAGNINKIMNSTVVNTQTNFSSIVQSIINNFNNSQSLVKWYIKSIFPIDVTVNNGVYSGTHIQQLQALCVDYNMHFTFTLPDAQGVGISFSFIGYNANSQQQFTLNSQTGLIGYPTVIPFGLQAKEFFNPNRNINDKIILETSYKALAGTYYVWQMSMILQTNDEMWETTLTLLNVNNPLINS